ncbi:hypothetical protein RCL1_003188 [Eukaryota sp. TZLM3-RCL]
MDHRLKQNNDVFEMNCILSVSLPLCIGQHNYSLCLVPGVITLSQCIILFSPFNPFKVLPHSVIDYFHDPIVLNTSFNPVFQVISAENLHNPDPPHLLVSNQLTHWSHERLISYWSRYQNGLNYLRVSICKRDLPEKTFTFLFTFNDLFGFFSAVDRFNLAIKGQNNSSKLLKSSEFTSFDCFLTPLLRCTSHILPFHLRPKTHVPIFNSTTDGLSLSTLKFRLKNVSNFILIVKTTDNEVAGAFVASQHHVPINISSPKQTLFFGGRNSFVFKISGSIFQHFEVKESTSVCCTDWQTFFSIGGGTGYSLFLDGKLFKGSTSVSSLFENELLFSQPQFIVQSVFLIQCK